MFPSAGAGEADVRFLADLLAARIFAAFAPIVRGMVREEISQRVARGWPRARRHSIYIYIYCCCRQKWLDKPRHYGTESGATIRICIASLVSMDVDSDSDLNGTG